jgi:hypothetical protein
MSSFDYPFCGGLSISWRNCIGEDSDPISVNANPPCLPKLDMPEPALAIMLITSTTATRRRELGRFAETTALSLGVRFCVLKST